MGEPGRRVVAWGIAVMACAGCVGIPADGPVTPGGRVGSDLRDGVLQVFPEGPVTGAGPEPIIAGFLRASSGFFAEHQVARSFLVPVRRQTWKPDATVGIYSGGADLDIRLVSLDDEPVMGDDPPADEQLAAAQSAEVAVVATLTASIDAAGHYREEPAGTRARTKFSLQRLAGEWRISGLDQGILISRTDFDLTFRSFPVYFADPTGDYLVPDVRWFPLTNSTATSLARALLAGPSAWLAPGVRSGAPPGTRLAVEAVPVGGRGVATVDLTAPARLADPRDQQILRSQLSATLTTLETISSVTLTIDGRPFRASGLAGAPRLQRDPPVDPRPVVIDGEGRIARAQGPRIVPVPEVAALAGPGLDAPGVALDGRAYAALDRDRSRLRMQVAGAATTRTLLTGRDLTAPSFDSYGWVWSVSAGKAASVQAAGQGPDPVAVRAPWLSEYTVHSLRLSRDGTRALVAADQGRRAVLLVSAVQRDANGIPQGLTPPLEVIPDLTEVSGAAWVDEDQVVVLARRRGGPEPGARQAWIVQISGPASALPPRSGAASIAAGNGDLDLYMATDSGVLYVRAGLRWVEVGQGRSPAFPG